MNKTKLQWPVFLGALVLLMSAAGASAQLVPYNDNLTTGTGWTKAVSQDSAASVFGPGGLTITTNPFGNPIDFQRQAAAYTGRNDLGWGGQSGPITYSMGISDFAAPMVSGSGYEANMLLVGNAGALPNFADFNGANVLMLRVGDFGPQAFLGGNNQYGAELWIKTGAANASIFDGTKVAAYYNSTAGQLLNPNGNWSFTINPNGSAFITTPNGQISTPGQFTGTGLMPAGSEAFFNTANVYLQVNNGNQAAGDSVTFSSVQAIPEPSTVFTMLGGLGLVVGRFLFSRKRTSLVT
jgi:hypothetical protein